MTEEVTLSSPITILTIVNLCLGTLYYIMAIIFLDISSYQLPYIIEVPVTIAFTIGPVYLVAHRKEIGFFDDVSLYKPMPDRVRSGTAMMIVGYLYGCFVTFMWLGRIYCNVLGKCE